MNGRWILLLCGVTMLVLGASGGGASADNRVAVLEARVAKLEGRLKNMEIMLRVNNQEMHKRLEQMDIVYQRTLWRVADLCGEDPDAVGVILPEDLKEDVNQLKDFRAGGRFAKRKVCHKLADRGRDALGAVPDLIATLRKDEDCFTRQYAARALGSICDGATGPLARKAVAGLRVASQKDKEVKVRKEAVEALKRIVR